MALAELQRDLGFALTVLRRRPFHLFLQVTNRCNMRCAFCDFWPNGVPPHEELTLEDYRRLEGELSRLGTFLISLEGGEPFVRPDIIDIVRIFSMRHLPILYTNGWYIDEQAARSLFAAGLTQIGVSIDYPDAARHDANRGLPGTWERAWRAVELCRDAAPHGGRQVHVMTVFMRDNAADLETLLRMSEARGVGHCITLLAKNGYRRGQAGFTWPEPNVSAHLHDLWKRYRHFRIFTDYLERMDPFLARGPMPDCRAGLQSFNIDHVGNVTPCIEKIDRVVGNVRREPLGRIHARLVELDAGKGCQQCWTACRGFNQALGGGGTLRNWLELGTRLRSH
jgi:MoaA/NifB/PqqE/SkfB family radical SAM enzyme